MFNRETSSNKIPHYHVTAGVIYNKGKILIVQRQSIDAFKELWELWKILI